MSREKRVKPEAAKSPPIPKRGEVWMVKQNPVILKDPHLPRPVVIMSTDPRNRHWDSVIVVPFSTGLRNAFAPFHKFVPAGEGGLPKDSHARCDLVSNLEKTCLDSAGPLGPRLSEKYIWDIARGVRASIGDDPGV